MVFRFNLTCSKDRFVQSSPSRGAWKPDENTQKNKYDIWGQKTQSPLVRERHPKAEINKSQTEGIWLFFLFWRRAWPRCCESSCRIVWFWLDCCYGFNRVLPLPTRHCSPCSGGMQTGLSQGNLSLMWGAALQLYFRSHTDPFLGMDLSLTLGFISEMKPRNFYKLCFCPLGQTFLCLSLISILY